MIVADTLIESMRVLWRRFRQEEAQLVDLAARYPGRVVSQSGQGMDLVLDDDRIPPMPGVQLAAVPGTSPVLRPGTRVTLGWLGADERYPRAFLEWDGVTGAVSVAQAVDQGVRLSRNVDAPATLLPLLRVDGDVAGQHGLVQGPYPSVSAGVGVPTFVDGTDQWFRVSVILAAQQSVGATLFTASFGRAYTGSRAFAVAGCDSGWVSVVATLSGVTVKAGANDYSGGLIMDAGTYVIDVFTGGTVS